MKRIAEHVWPFALGLVPIVLLGLILTQPPSNALADSGSGSAGSAVVALATGSGSGSGSATDFGLPPLGALPTAVPTAAATAPATALPSTPADQANEVATLFKHGSLIGAMILAFYWLLSYASATFAFLKKGKIALVVAVVLGGLVVMVQSIVAGQAPSLDMLLAAGAAAGAIATHSKLPQFLAAQKAADSSTASGTIAK